jgi:hypothetical protein
MADREFDTDAEREAYAAGIEEAAKKVQKPPLTMADVRKMDKDEVAARMPEVRAALKRGESTDAGEGAGDDTST